MCIRDSQRTSPIAKFATTAIEVVDHRIKPVNFGFAIVIGCLLYTSDAADERSSVDLGGRRIIKKKKH